MQKPNAQHFPFNKRGTVQLLNANMSVNRSEVLLSQINSLNSKFYLAVVYIFLLELVIFGIVWKKHDHDTRMCFDKRL